MDAEITATLQEFLALTGQNLRGRNIIEAAVRARALQEISALPTEDLTRLAKGVSDRSG